MALAIRNLMFTSRSDWGTRGGNSGTARTTGQENAGACPARAGEELKNLIFKCMSTRAVDMLKEDMEIMARCARGMWAGASARLWISRAG